MEQSSDPGRSEVSRKLKGVVNRRAVRFKSLLQGLSYLSAALSTLFPVYVYDEDFTAKCDTASSRDRILAHVCEMWETWCGLIVTCSLEGLAEASASYCEDITTYIVCCAGKGICEIALKSYKET